MPKVKKGETQKKYISRCIPFVINEGTTKDPSQAAAICHSLWDKHKKNSKAESLLGIPEVYIKELSDEELDGILEEDLKYYNVSKVIESI